jgi:hypothetical protein
MPAETIQPIQDILNRWILIGQALVGSIGALAFVVALTWTSKYPSAVVLSSSW